jgi:hypothetical protein
VDWQATLLSAIQHRDAGQARVLAQRCVHRHGMQALETLLDRLTLGPGPDEEARRWLFLLLREDGSESAIAQAEPQMGLASGMPEHPEPGHDPFPKPALQSERASRPEPAPPEREAMPSSSPRSDPDGRPLAINATNGSAVSPAPLSGEPSPSRPSACNDLDQAFAPLEIAFPPLPSQDWPEETSRPLSSPKGRHPLPEFEAPMFKSSQDVAGVGIFLAREEGPMDTPAATDFDPEDQLGWGADSDFPLDSSSLNEDEVASHAVAAPMPNFQVESPRVGDPHPLHEVQQPQPSSQERLSTSPSLAAWRAWLPGAFRQRQRP